MTTDAGRAGVLADVVATRLNDVRYSLMEAHQRIDLVETMLENGVTQMSRLNEQAFELAATARREGQDESAFRDQVWQRLNPSRELAEGVRDGLRRAQRTLAGEMTQFDDVPSSALEELDTTSRAISDAGQALDELERISGHDASAAERLRERMDLMRGAVDQSRGLVTDVDGRLNNARLGLAALNRDGYLSADQDPVALAMKIALASNDVGRDIGRAQREVARSEGAVDTVRAPAGRAADDSADLAARAGLNPTPPDQQRHVVSSSEQSLHDRLDGGPDHGTDRSR
jgi:hypothetical protein